MDSFSQFLNIGRIWTMIEIQINKLASCFGIYEVNV